MFSSSHVVHPYHDAPFRFEFLNGTPVAAHFYYIKGPNGESPRSTAGLTQGAHGVIAIQGAAHQEPLLVGRSTRQAGKSTWYRIWRGVEHGFDDGTGDIVKLPPLKRSRSITSRQSSDEGRAPAEEKLTRPIRLKFKRQSFDPPQDDCERPRRRHQPRYSYSEVDEDVESFTDTNLPRLLPVTKQDVNQRQQSNLPDLSSLLPISATDISGKDASSDNVREPLNTMNSSNREAVRDDMSNAAPVAAKSPSRVPAPIALGEKSSVTSGVQDHSDANTHGTDDSTPITETTDAAGNDSAGIAVSEPRTSSKDHLVDVGAHGRSEDQHNYQAIDPSNVMVNFIDNEQSCKRKRTFAEVNTVGKLFNNVLAAKLIASRHEDATLFIKINGYEEEVTVARNDEQDWMDFVDTLKRVLHVKRENEGEQVFIEVRAP